MSLCYLRPIDYLISGYIEREFSSESKDRKICYPLELNGIIVAFVGNFLMRFDIIHHAYSHHLRQSGTMLKRADGMRGYYIACSSTSFSSGIHEFKVRLHKPKDDAIGIISSLQSCSLKPTFWGNAFGNLYYYYGDGQITEKRDGQKAINHYGEKGWNKDNIIRVRVDCDNWTVQFFNGSNKMTKGKINIEPGMTYYPMIGTQSDDVEYELISYESDRYTVPMEQYRRRKSISIGQWSSLMSEFSF